MARAAGAGTAPAAISAESLRALARHDFPGNVRELENVLERASALCTDGEVTPDCLTLARPGGATAFAPGGGAGTTAPGGATRGRDDAERERILAALNETRWNRRRAAERLGMTYRQLRYRIETMGLDGDAAA